MIQQGIIDSELAKHPAWKSRLIIGIINFNTEISLDSKKPLENEEFDKNDTNQIINGFKIPTSTIFDKYEQYIRGSFKNGKLHGFVQIYGKMTADPNGHCSSTLFSGLSFVGWFEDGKPTGKVGPKTIRPICILYT